MGLFSAMLGGPRASSSDDGHWLTDSDRWYGGSAGNMSNAGRRVSTDGALRVSAAYGSISLLSKTVATLPLRMFRTDRATGRRTEAPNHPLNDILEYQPNHWQSAWDFKAMMMGHLALRGNAYAEIVAGPRGFVDSLEPIHPDRVSVDRLIDGTIRYTVSGTAKGTRVLLQDEVLHLRSHMAPGGLVGISPVSYARETIGLAMAAEEHGARMFSNGARPSGVVTVEKSMSDPAFERFKSQWNQMYSGLSNAGKTPILEDGAKFQAISLTAEDAQFLQTREFQIEEVARWFDVPLVLLHHMTKTSSWGTGVEAIMLAFVRNNLMPWLGCWTGAIRRDLILAPGLYEAAFDVEPLIAGDSKAQAEFYSRLVLNGVLTRNEARAALGYNPIDGLDEPLVPTNTATPDNMPQHSPPPTGGSALLGHNGGPAIEDQTPELENDH
jgi:HK97 family phage portal protein